MQVCRLCEAKKKELLTFEVNIINKKIFICDRCLHFIKNELATLNICLFCGNIFLSYETPIKNPTNFIERCSICYVGNQIIKGGVNGKEKEKE
jgi:hypothetical protein